MDEVSRETWSTPSLPDVAERVFSRERLPLATRYAELLAGPGVDRGLLGPREAPRLWQRHLLNCAVLADLIPEGARVCDVGTGAGLPGIVVAIARPDLEMVLVEPLLRRTTYLLEVIEELGLDRVSVERARAEELHGRVEFDVVTSRAVAPLERILGWSMPLLNDAGQVLAMKGAKAAEEVEALGDLPGRRGCAAPEVLSVGAGVVDPPTKVVRVTWGPGGRVSWPLAVRPSSAPPSPAPSARKRRRQRG